MAKPERPMGVTLLAVIYVIGGFCAIVLGLLAGTILTKVLGSALSGLATIVGILFIVIGLIALVDAYGLWKGMKWAWWLTVILSALGVIFGIATLIGSPAGGIIDIIIDGAIVYYLTTKSAKAYFNM